MFKKTIWKFPVPIADSFSIPMPRGARILTINTQNGEPVLYALVDPKELMVSRKFALRGTGHNAESLDLNNYIGTFQMYGGDIVFHLFNDPNNII